MVWPGGIHPMLLPESSWVCIPSFRSFTQRVCQAKHHINFFVMVTTSQIFSPCFEFGQTYDYCKFQRNLLKKSTCQNVLECELETISVVLCLHSASINVVLCLWLCN